MSQTTPPWLKGGPGPPPLPPKGCSHRSLSLPLGSDLFSWAADPPKGRVGASLAHLGTPLVVFDQIIFLASTLRGALLPQFFSGRTPLGGWSSTTIFILGVPPGGGGLGPQFSFWEVHTQLSSGSALDQVHTQLNSGSDLDQVDTHLSSNQVQLSSGSDLDQVHTHLS